MPCPICNGESCYMGNLGHLAHWCCRCCGWWFYTEDEGGE